MSCSELSPFGEIEFGDPNLAHVVMQGGQAVTPGLFMPSGTTALLIPGGEIPLLPIILAEKRGKRPGIANLGLKVLCTCWVMPHPRDQGSLQLWQDTDPGSQPLPAPIYPWGLTNSHSFIQSSRSLVVPSTCPGHPILYGTDRAWLVPLSLFSS